MRDRIEKALLLRAPIDRVWRALSDTREFEPPTLLSMRWHPSAVDPSVDYESEQTTLVTFQLRDVDCGTQLTVTESGFDALPEWRRSEANRGNDEGWSEQMRNIERHVAGSA